jgi:hypothetical protein
MTRLVKTGVWIGAVVVLIGGGLAFATLSANKIGDTCQRDDDCRSGVCLRQKGNVMTGYCTTNCAQGEPCPSGWACEEIRVDTYDGKGGGPKVSHTKTCVKAAARSP